MTLPESEIGQRCIHTIGHSNHPGPRFLELLQAHDVKLLVDTRSRPGSRWAPYTRPKSLQALLAGIGVAYLYLGETLGGRPDDPGCYDPITGRPDYAVMRARPAFREGLAQLMAAGARTCIMCSEEDPAHCHRALLIGKALRDEGYSVFHIRGTGALQDDDTVLGASGRSVQLSLGRSL